MSRTEVNGSNYTSSKKKSAELALAAKLKSQKLAMLQNLLQKRTGNGTIFLTKRSVQELKGKARTYSYVVVIVLPSSSLLFVG